MLLHGKIYNNSIKTCCFIFGANMNMLSCKQRYLWWVWRHFTTSIVGIQLKSTDFQFSGGNCIIWLGGMVTITSLTLEHAILSCVLLLYNVNNIDHAKKYLMMDMLLQNARNIMQFFHCLKYMTQDHIFFPHCQTQNYECICRLLWPIKY